jgi:hypothetical protein
MKLFPEDKDGESWGWKYSVVDADYEVLCGAFLIANVSVFTTLFSSASLEQSPSSP